MAAKTVLIGTPRKDGAGSPAHEEWTTGDTPQDPDGNALLTAAAGGGSSVSGLKGATVIATGSLTAGSPQTVINLGPTSTTHAFFMFSLLGVTNNTVYGSNVVANGKLGIRQYRDTVGGPPLPLVIDYHSLDLIHSGSAGTLFYKVYKIDET